jgi:hypothetical protein
LPSLSGLFQVNDKNEADVFGNTGWIISGFFCRKAAASCAWSCFDGKKEQGSIPAGRIDQKKGDMSPGAEPFRSWPMGSARPQPGNLTAALGFAKVPKICSVSGSLSRFTFPRFHSMVGNHASSRAFSEWVAAA